VVPFRSESTVPAHVVIEQMLQQICQLKNFLGPRLDGIFLGNEVLGILLNL